MPDADVRRADYAANSLRARGSRFKPDSANNLFQIDAACQCYPMIFPLVSRRAC